MDGGAAKLPVRYLRYLKPRDAALMRRFHACRRNSMSFDLTMLLRLTCSQGQQSKDAANGLNPEPLLFAKCHRRNESIYEKGES